MSMSTEKTGSEEARMKKGPAETEGVALADEELDAAAGGMMMPAATMISGGNTQTSTTVERAGTRKSGLHGGRNGLIATGDNLVC